MSGAGNDVSNSHEPSYYEIALTNRQVIVAFVLLLLCLIAAFFSGVWIGRESGARLAAEQMVRNAPPPEEKKEGQNLEELQFFDQTKKGKGAKAAETKAPEPAPAQSRAAAPVPAQSTAQVTPPAAAAGTDPTLGNDLGEDTEAAPRNPPQNPIPTPATPPKHQKPAPTPAPTPKASPEKVAQAKPAQETPAARTAKTPKKAADATADPAHAAGQVVIQVFSSAEKDQAVRIRDRLVGGGQKAYLSPVEVAGRTMYRVRIGPFDSRDQAQKVAEQVRKGYKLDTWVTE